MNALVDDDDDEEKAMLRPLFTRDELARFLAEDAPYGDLTTSALGIEGRPAEMHFSARADMVVAGLEIAVGLLDVAGADVHLSTADGRWAGRGAELLVARGSSDVLHRAWKQAQTTIEILSGVATAARRVVEAANVGGRRIPVACTRKTLVGARRQLVSAICAGGAVPHRLGLSETVLVFAEHRAFLPEVGLAEMVERLRFAAPEKKLVIEVADPQEALAAAVAGFDVVQMEKFTPEDVALTTSLVKGGRPDVVLASAGGIDPTNAGDHAAAGADVIVTSWPYTARPCDVQVRLRPV